MRAMGSGVSARAGKLPGMGHASSTPAGSGIMTQSMHISSYRLAYWHAPKRARHEEGDVFTCVFCQYSEGIARMKDVVAHLRRVGFPITNYDTRSFTIEIDRGISTTADRQLSPTARLSAYVSGRFSRLPAKKVATSPVDPLDPLTDHSCR